MRCIAIEEAFLTGELADAYLALPPEVVERDRDVRQMHMMLKSIPRLRELLTDVGAGRLALMDAAGVDVALLSAMAPGVQSMDAVQAQEHARAANDALAAAIQAHPARFGGLACIGPQDPEAAALEIERAVTKLGLSGVLINSHTHGEYLDHPRYTPIFEVLQQLDVPLYLHPRCPPHEAMRLLRCDGPAPPDALAGVLHPGGGPRISEAFWGFHMEASLHVARLIVTGVFERFPRLKLVLGHMGEGLPATLERMDWAARLGFGMARPPSEYFLRNCYVTTSGLMDRPLGHRTLQFCIDVMGADRVLFAADHPFGSMKETRAAVLASGLSDEVVAGIMHGNAQSLYRLPAAPPVGSA